MTKTFGRFTALSTILAAGLIAAGCGGDDNGGDSTVASDASPEEVVTAFYEATADGDAATVCDLVTDETAQQAADDGEADSCEAATEGTLDDEESQKVAEGITVGDATVDGDSATVDVSSDDTGGSGTVDLVQEDGEWKIDFSNGSS